MTTRFLTVERMEVASKKSFEETAAAFEKRVPQADVDVLTRLIAVRAGAAEIAAVVRRMACELEFLTLARVEQGPLVSLLGRQKKIRVYLLGNPVLANRMFEQDPGVGLYALHEEQELPLARPRAQTSSGGHP